MLKWLTRWFGSSRSAATTDWVSAVRPAWYALKNKDIADAIRLAEPLKDHRNSVIAGQARRVLGLAHSRVGDYAAACEHLLAAAKQSDDALDWFNLATSAVMAEEYKLADEAIEMATSRPWRSPHIQTLSRPQMRFHYLQALVNCEQYERAFGQLDEIRKIYERFRSTAHDLLQFKKVPFLKRVLDTGVPALRAMRDKYDVDRWLDDFAARLDSAGANLVEQTRRKVHARVASSDAVMDTIDLPEETVAPTEHTIADYRNEK